MSEQQSKLEILSITIKDLMLVSLVFILLFTMLKGCQDTRDKDHYLRVKQLELIEQGKLDSVIFVPEKFDRH